MTFRSWVVDRDALRAVIKQNTQSIMTTTEMAVKLGPVKAFASENIVTAQLTKIEAAASSTEVLEENPISKQLQHVAIEVQVTGTGAGRYYLVPYKGKLKNFTMKKPTAMFIPQMRFGKQKPVPVFVVEEDSVIFIAKENFKVYEKGLTVPEGFEL